jgi:uncharacterized protein (DUF305 family)
MKCNILKNKTINDKDFLETMIVHHQAAIDMSKLINLSSTNDTILAFARNIIFNQTKEVFLMKTLFIETKYSINENTKNKPLRNTFKSEYPSIFKNLQCDESHFNFNHHSNHNMSDSEYVKHMISHHNTALELSKLIIASTKNPQILAIAETINLDQAKEIFELYFLEKSLNTHWRNSFTPFKEYDCY